MFKTFDDVLSELIVSVPNIDICRLGETKRCSQFPSFNPGYKYENGLVLNFLLYIYGHSEPHTT